MLNGQKFEAVPKGVIGSAVGFYIRALESNPEAMTQFINAADRWASGYGYEYHSMTDTCVVFKRVGG